jgi:hypothetical protein
LKQRTRFYAASWEPGKTVSPLRQELAQQTSGKIQNAVGGFKDAVKEAVND